MSSSSERRAQITRRLNFFANIVGMDIYTYDYTIFNWRLAVFVVTSIVFLISTAYSFKIYAGDLEKTVFCLVTLGLFAKAVMQASCLVGGRRKLFEILEVYETFYARSEELGVEHILDQFCSYMEKILKLMQVLYSSAGIASNLNPFIVKVLTGNLVLTFGFEIPFIDPYTTVGYPINYAFHLYTSFIGVAGFIAGDGIVMSSIIPIFSIFESLVVLIEDLKNYENINDEEIKERRYIKFKTIVELHQMLNDLISELENFFVISNFICIYTIIIQCVASLFALISAQWYLGFTFVVVTIFQIFVFCIFGTVLEIMQERFREKISEIHWIDKDQTEKRDLIIMLTATKKISNFTCLLSKLNLDTFMSVRA